MVKLIACFLLFACISLISSEETVINAGGATFPAVVYSAWQSSYSALRGGTVSIDYALTGSGGGFTG